jgi:ABC-type multidrug transport system fused ATPase/permease subunit
MSTKYIKFWSNIIPRSRLLITNQIDFGVSPIRSLLSYKKRIAMLALFNLVMEICNILIAFVIPIIIMSQNNQLLWVVGLLIGRSIFDVVFCKYYLLLLNNYTSDLKRSAVTQIIRIDPIFHSTKSSGQIISKINRASDSTTNWLNNLIFYPVKILVGYTALCIGAFSVDIRLFWFLIILIPVICIVNILLTNYNNNRIMQISLDYQDQSSQTMVESLTQFNIIRSTYSTDLISSKFTQELDNYTYHDSLRWRIWQIVIVFVDLINFVVIGVFFYLIIPTLDFSNPLLAGVLINLFLFLMDLWRIGINIKDYQDARLKIKDLFTFVNSFGSQNIKL